jgi:HEAT repeat protein
MAAFDYQKLYEDLRGRDKDIAVLGLSTLSRLQPDREKVSRELLKQIYHAVKAHRKSTDEEIKEAAEAAFNQMKATMGGLINQFIEEDRAVLNLNELRSSNPQIRGNCLRLILEEGASAAFPHIIRLLASENEPQNLILCIEALQQFGKGKTSRLLEIFLMHPDKFVRVSAIESMQKELTDDEIIVKILPYTSDVEEIVRSAAITCLMKVPFESILQKLRKMINNADLVQRKLAHTILAGLKGEHCISLLNIAANDPLPEMKLQVLNILNQIHDPQIMPIIQRLAQDPDFDVSEKAMMLLSQPRDDSSGDPDLFDLVNLTSMQQQELEQEEKIKREEEERQEQKLKEQEAKKEAAKAAIDTTKIDSEIDSLMMKIGEKLHKMHKSGMLKEDSFATLLFEIDTTSAELDEIESSLNSSGLLGSLKTKFGKVDLKVQQAKVQTKLEDFYLELGDLAFEQFQANGKQYPDTEKEINRIQSLFQQLKILSQ